MCALDYFDHYSPTAGLETPMARYLHALHDWGAEQPASAMVGENVFYCSVTSDVYNAAYAHQSLMNSPGHRANILDPRFTKVGVGPLPGRPGPLLGHGDVPARRVAGNGIPRNAASRPPKQFCRTAS